MIDLATEHILSLHQAAQRIPSYREGRPTHVSKVLRDILKGARRPDDGETVYLEGLRLGGRWVTSVEALQRFAEALTPLIGANQGRRSRPSTTRRKAIEQANQEAAALVS